MSTTLTALAGLLPARLQPYAKAIFPALLAAIAVLVQYANTGSFDDTAMATAITGASAALVAFHTSNHHDLLHDEEDDVPEADDLGRSIVNYPPPTGTDGFAPAPFAEEALVNGPRSG
jgi:hypothetical protein